MPYSEILYRLSILECVYLNKIKLWFLIKLKIGKVAAQRCTFLMLKQSAENKRVWATKELIGGLDALRLRGLSGPNLNEFSIYLYIKYKVFHYFRM